MLSRPVSEQTLAVVHHWLHARESSVQKASVKQGLEGRVEESKICWKVNRELWVPGRV